MVPSLCINLTVNRCANTSHSYAYPSIGSRKCDIVTLLGQQSALVTISPCAAAIIPVREKIDEDKRMSVRATVASHFEQVALEQKRKLARLTDDLKLLESGLDSLSFALIVVRLEETLGFDPFDAAEEMNFPVTFGDFVKLYESHGN